MSKADAAVVVAIAEATAKGLEQVAKTLSSDSNAKDAVTLKIAQEYIHVWPQNRFPIQ